MDFKLSIKKGELKLSPNLVLKKIRKRRFRSKPPKQNYADDFELEKEMKKGGIIFPRNKNEKQKRKRRRF